MPMTIPATFAPTFFAFAVDLSTSSPEPSADDEPDEPLPPALDDAEPDPPTSERDDVVRDGVAVVAVVAVGTIVAAGVVVDGVVKSVKA